MKRIVSIMMFMLLISATQLQAQSPSFECRVENEVMVSSTVYEFDVKLYATGSTTTWEYAQGVYYINMNSAFRNAGTMTVAAVSSTSELNSGQVPTAFSYQATNNYIIIGSKTPPGAGSGTVITQSGVRVIRVRLTTSSSWGSGVAPNFTFRWATPNTGINAYVSAVNTAIANNTVTAGQAFCLTPVYYTSGSNAWNSSPVATRDAVVMSGTATASSAMSCRGLRIQSGASLTINSGILLSVAGNLSNGGTLTGTGADLELVGIGATANQTWSGNGATFRDVVIGVAGNTTTKTLSAPLSVSRNLQLQGTATLAAGGNLSLLSSASGTARLLELPASANVTGNVTVERFVPGASGRRYRYLAAPFASGPSIANSWQQQVHITGTGTGGTLCPSLTAHSNGFDATMSNASSMFTFNETGATNTNVAGSNGGTLYTNAWISVANTASTNLTWGTGYKIFIRGNRIQGCDLLNGANPAPSNVTLSGTGTLKTGNASFPITYSSSNGEGWNLVGNPYACPINWDAAGWTRTNVDNMVWIFRPAGNHFSTWNGATGLGANFGSNIIESGNAFFVKANASSPVLVATEAVKTGASPATPLFKTNIKALRVNFIKPGELTDELVVAMSPEAQDGLDAMDSEKMTNPSLNIYAKDAVGNENAINTFKAAQAETVVPVGINTTFTGMHTFSFKGETEFNAYDVLLEDKYLGVIQLVNDNPTYQFEITANPLTFGENRFRLIFVNRGDFDYLKRIQGIYKNVNGVVNMYPNPTAQVTSVQVPNMSGNMAQVKVYNAVGQELMSFSSAINKGNSSFEIDLGVQSSGVYFVEVTDELGKVSKGKLVKN
jgi:hypothetical protein